MLALLQLALAAIMRAISMLDFNFKSNSILSAICKHESIFFFNPDSETLKPRKMFNIFCQTLFNIRCTVSWITHNYFSKLKDRWDDIVKLNRQDFSQFKKEPFASAGPKKSPSLTQYPAWDYLQIFWSSFLVNAVRIFVWKFILEPRKWLND